MNIMLYLFSDYFLLEAKILFSFKNAFYKENVLVLMNFFITHARVHEVGQ